MWSRRVLGHDRVAERRTCASSDTSHTCVVIRVRPAPGLGQRLRLGHVLGDTSQIATWQPSAASCRASSRPMPVPPPVTTASFPRKLFIVPGT